MVNGPPVAVKPVLAVVWVGLVDPTHLIAEGYWICDAHRWRLGERRIRQAEKAHHEAP